MQLRASASGCCGLCVCMYVYILIDLLADKAVVLVLSQIFRQVQIRLPEAWSALLNYFSCV